MNTSATRESFDELEGMLRLAVEQIASAPPPVEVAERVLSRAAKWDAATKSKRQDPHPGPLPKGEGVRKRLYLAAGAALALVVLVAVAIAIIGGLPREKSIAVSPPVEKKEPKNTMEPNANHPDAALAAASPSGVGGATPAAAGTSPDMRLGMQPHAGFGGSGGFGANGGIPSKRGGITAGFIPRRWLSVASDATILVALGGKNPIQLGAKQPNTKESILHVWDWSKSDKSRPLSASAGSFSVSPDGKWIVTAKGEQIEIATGKVTTLPHFEPQPQKVLFSRDGRRLALLLSGENEAATFRILDFPSGKKLCEIENQWPLMLPAAFTPDSSEIFLMGKDNFVRRYDAASGKELQKYEPAHEDSVRTMVVSPSGKLLVSGGLPGDVLLWDVSSGKLLHKLVIEPAVFASDGVHALAFSPDETQIAGGNIGSVLLWSVETGQVKKFPDSSASAEHIRFAADGKSITIVRGITATAGPAGEYLSVYPSVSKWDVAQAKDENLRVLIDKVLAAHGGEDNLSKLQFTMTIKHSNGEMQHYFVQPPKNFRWETTHPDQTGKRIVILFPEGRRWWTKEPGAAAREFIPTGLEPLSVEGWFDYVKFFGPRQVLRLKDADHKVAPLGEEAKIGGRAAVGVQVTGPHYDHKMYFDKETHLLLKGVGSDILREVTFGDYKKFEAIPIAQKEHDGHFDPEVTDFKAVDKFDDKLFEQP